MDRHSPSSQLRYERAPHPVSQRHSPSDGRALNDLTRTFSNTSEIDTSAKLARCGRPCHALFESRIQLECWGKPARQIEFACNQKFIANRSSRPKPRAGASHAALTFGDRLGQPFPFLWAQQAEPHLK